MAENVASNVTSKIGEISAVVDSYVGPVLKNNYFKGALFLFFGLYAGFLAPALPNSVLHFFDTVVGKLLFIFLIAFIATRQIDGSIGVALIVAVMFLLTLTVLNNVKMNESFRNLGMEHFELMNQMRDVVNDQSAKNKTVSTTNKKVSSSDAPKPDVTTDSSKSVSVKTTRTRKECLDCVMALPLEDRVELQNEFCKHEPIPAAKSAAVPAVPKGSAEHFESHYANFDL
jgi:ABC-type multidrug transport system fused ATPase/permease subunit